MKKLLLELSVLFSTIIIILSPAGTMKAKAAGNIIDGVIFEDAITDGTHTGDYIGKNTIIDGTGSTSYVFLYKTEIYPSPSDYFYTLHDISSTQFDYSDFVNEFDQVNSGDNAKYYDQNLTYNAFEITSFTTPYVLYLKRVNITYPPQADSGSSVTKGSTAVTTCDHDYEWTTINDATEDYEGLEVCRCTKCGAVCASRSIPKLSDDFSYVTEKYIKQYEQAKSGQTIKLDLKNWNSIPKSFFEELAKRRDITTTIRFIYNHKVYEFTIERGQSVDTSVDYYGPEKLIQLYGAKEVVTK